MSKGAVEIGQRTAVLVFPSPGPEIIELDTKIETAAKFVPGIGLVVQGAQNERDLAASQDLQKYLPKWRAQETFYPLLMKELGTSGHPGRLLSAEEAGITPAALHEFNQAENLLDWRLRYYIQNPNRPVPRNYSKLLSLDDALILEVNLAWGVNTDGEGNATPALSGVIKLVRANTMRTLWRHEETVDNKEGTKTLYEFKAQPQDLISKYEEMMPDLAAKLAQSYSKNLKEAGIFSAPQPEPAPEVAVSSPTAVAASSPTAVITEISTQNYAAPSSSPAATTPETRH